ncbi:hypothetical protein PF005_g18688 [Phytophthora fragariae]|uniref:Uncharacterized protein n=1 Tax=Phytophthora fragariae TaxID=53985 RepID=A0A6A3EK24_9STRA|nr:hypothetical protein PF003_g34789 [Phytophthora fragariae]KAE8932647.1 hypothetical protein PF009_g17334 [Phytophthora fragariae]KAE8995173.1 hypothetical protein PF011_g16440 [Phytophthora fragariae]KAE9091137.1 hypothetical protein PF010_g18307 [Phytophthora fragariae]KAE9101796.1 hypothetical protein PF007_g14995 [Phytophthora fragariae]
MASVTSLVFLPCVSPPIGCGELLLLSSNTSSGRSRFTGPTSSHFVCSLCEVHGEIEG